MFLLTDFRRAKGRYPEQVAQQHGIDWTPLNRKKNLAWFDENKVEIKMDDSDLEWEDIPFGNLSEALEEGLADMDKHHNCWIT